MNEFFHWGRAHDQTLAHQPGLTEAEQDELFVLMNDEAIPPEAMSAEMADGYMTACIVGPEPMPAHEWLEAIFEQPTLPLPHNPERQQRLPVLLLRRYADIDTSTLVDANNVTRENLLMPLVADIADEDRITPYALDEHGERLGAWDLQDWGEGFRRAVAEGSAWEPLVSNPETSGLLAGVILSSMGYNPDHLDYQLEEDEDRFPWLIVSVITMRTWWREQRDAQNALTLVRGTPKVGRNDPCPCGSGKKYKKCCGAN